MYKYVAILAAVLLLVAVGMVYGDGFPKLSEAVNVGVLPCEDMVFKAYFETPAGQYVYFGRVDTREAEPKPLEPYIWILFKGEEMVEITLVDVDKKPRRLTKDELMAKFPSPCALVGTGA